MKLINVLFYILIGTSVYLFATEREFHWYSASTRSKIIFVVELVCLILIWVIAIISVVQRAQ